MRDAPIFVMPLEFAGLGCAMLLIAASATLGASSAPKAVAQ
ncbi:hypothetical protein [Massilia sp. CCM 8734]|nr:hypothetical protein [Massilia sp. CCM 8734]